MVGKSTFVRFAQRSRVMRRFHRSSAVAKWAEAEERSDEAAML